MTKTILITGARAPVALHFARVLKGAGHRVILADTQHFPLARATKFKDKYLKFPKPSKSLKAFGEAIEAIVSAENCDLILPTCEEIFYLAAWRDVRQRNIPLLAPHFSKLAAVHNKYEFALSTKAFALAATETHLLESQSDIKNFQQDPELYVFKPVWSRFASQVLMCPKREVLSAIRPTTASPWLAQKFLPGEELCCWALAHQGEVRAISAYRPLQRAGLGASIAFAPIIDEAITHFAAAYCKQLNWSGQISFDFRRDVEGHLHVLECNPRATSGVHFFGSNSTLAAALLSEASASPDQQRAMSMPLAMLIYGLPQALKSHGFAGFNNWRRHLRTMQDITAWPNDRSLLPMQILSLLEITGKALRSGVSLTTAATYDIEWNGNPLGPAQ